MGKQQEIPTGRPRKRRLRSEPAAFREPSDPGTSEHY